MTNNPYEPPQDVEPPRLETNNEHPHEFVLLFLLPVAFAVSWIVFASFMTWSR